MAGYVEYWSLRECHYDDEGYNVEDTPSIGPLFYSVEKLHAYMEKNNLEANVTCIVGHGLTWKK